MTLQDVTFVIAVSGTLGALLTSIVVFFLNNMTRERPFAHSEFLVSSLWLGAAALWVLWLMSTA